MSCVMLAYILKKSDDSNQVGNYYAKLQLSAAIAAFCAIFFRR